MCVLYKLIGTAITRYASITKAILLFLSTTQYIQLIIVHGICSALPLNHVYTYPLDLPPLGPRVPYGVFGRGISPRSFIN